MRRAALLSVVALVGCSGGGDGNERLSEEDYRQRADAICAEYERRLARLENPRDVGELARFAEEALPIAREGLRRLRALRPPDELAARVRAWLERNEENVRTIARIRDAARAGDETRVQELASAGVDNEAQADRLARELGLRECAEDG